MNIFFQWLFQIDKDKYEVDVLYSYCHDLQVYNKFRNKNQMPTYWQ